MDDARSSALKCSAVVSPAAHSLRFSNDSSRFLERIFSYLEHATDSPRWSGGLKTPLGGVPPPLVFDFGRFVAWKEVLKDCVVKLGVLFKSWVMRGFWGGSGQVLDES